MLFARFIVLLSFLGFLSSCVDTRSNESIMKLENRITKTEEIILDQATNISQMTDKISSLERKIELLSIRQSKSETLKQETELSVIRLPQKPFFLKGLSKKYDTAVSNILSGNFEAALLDIKSLTSDYRKLGTADQVIFREYTISDVLRNLELLEGSIYYLQEKYLSSVEVLVGSLKYPKNPFGMQSTIPLVNSLHKLGEEEKACKVIYFLQRTFKSDTSFYVALSKMPSLSCN